jgi:sterol 3beta-glucosyltransferase
MSSFSTDTAEFSHRLKKKSHHEDVETLARTVTNGAEENFDPKKGITSKQFHHLAYRMAKKSYEDDYAKNFTKPNATPGLVAVRRKVEERKAKGGRGFQITSATAHYVGDLAVTGAKGELNPTIDARCSLTRSTAPVALFYNLANGFRNFPSYAIKNDPARRRDEITSFGSGCKLAGKV